MLAGLSDQPLDVLLSVSIIHFGCWFEYQKLVGLIDKDYRSISELHRYGIMIADGASCFISQITISASAILYCILSLVARLVVLRFFFLSLNFFFHIIYHLKILATQHWG
jgi:phosphatidate cytidylyltransferase